MPQSKLSSLIGNIAYLIPWNDLATQYGTDRDGDIKTPCFGQKFCFRENKKYHGGYVRVLAVNNGIIKVKPVWGGNAFPVPCVALRESE